MYWETQAMSFSEIIYQRWFVIVGQVKCLFLLTSQLIVLFSQKVAFVAFLDTSLCDIEKFLIEPMFVSKNVISTNVMASSYT